MGKEVGLMIPGQGIKTDAPNPTAVEALDSALSNFQSLVRTHTNLDIRKILGNSYGIYAALVIGGVLSYVAARELARIREELVINSEQKTKYPTGMVSIIGRSEAGIRTLISPSNDEIDRRNEAISESEEKIPSILITNYNGPFAYVIGGAWAYLEPIVEQVGSRAQRLATVGVYHHLSRSEDRINYAQIVRDYIFGKPEMEIISSTRPRILNGVKDFIRELVEQMVNPGELTKAVGLFQGVGVLIDNGPTEVMKKLASRLTSIPVLSAETEQDKIANLT